MINLKIKKKKKKFESFIVQLKIKSIEDARLLFHTFGCPNLLDLICKNNEDIYEEIKKYEGRISKYLDVGYVEALEEEILKFKISPKPPAKV